MSTAAQIEANRQNAQLSSGPVSETGKRKSSLNSTKHGLTGQTIIVPAEVKDAYDTHCLAYLDEYQPKTHQETELIQQYADQQWSLHQINTQQITVMGIMSATTSQHMQAGSDLETLNAAIAPLYKQMSNLSLYEQRRSRAAAATLARFQELAAARSQAVAEAAQACKINKAQGKPFDPSEFGFVCSTAEIETYLARQTLRADVLKALSAGRTQV